MDALDDEDDTLTVAAKAIYELCIDDGRFNGCTFGLKAVLRFLAEAVPDDEQPADDRPSIEDLAARMRKKCTVAELRQWAKEWYSRR